MDWLTAIFGAVKEFFGYKTKISPTPEQAEKQTARKERDENKNTIDDWMRSGSAGGVSDDTHGKPGGNIK